MTTPLRQRPYFSIVARFFFFFFIFPCKLTAGYEIGHTWGVKRWMGTLRAKTNSDGAAAPAAATQTAGTTTAAEITAGGGGGSV